MTMLRTSSRSIALLLALSATPATAQQAPAQPQTPRSQMPDLGRPTKSSDSLPLFNFESYFGGKWTFEWDVPESALGPEGTITGTTTFTKIDDTFYLATTEAKGPGGAITIKETIGYKKDNKAIARQVADSRGFAFTQVGTVGGDLGGYYNIYYDSAPFTVGGKNIRLRHTMRLLSPVNFKVEMRISEDGGPFVNFGTPWWKKEGGTR